MTLNITRSSLEEIHRDLMGDLRWSFDFESAPRGKLIRELVAPTFTLTDPRNRLITSPARAVNYGFAVGELCWYLRGDTDLETMRYYNKRMAQFSDDGLTINSAYGNRLFRGRWFGPPGSPSFTEGEGQFDQVLAELTADPASRRAVMHINEPEDLRRTVVQGSKDVPCTLSIQLLIRDRHLHMHVVMRSNDVVWGLPYDVFSFTCLQELFMLELRRRGVPVDDVGSYHHTAGSLHLYDTHWGMAGEVANEEHPWPAPMLPVTWDQMEWLATQYEPACRQSVGNPLAPLNVSWPPAFSSPERDADQTTLEWMVSMLVDHRDRRVIEKIEKDKREQQSP